MASDIIQRANVMPGAAMNLFSRTLGSPAAASSTAVLAATAAASASNVMTGLTSPPVPRNVTATPGGTTGNVLAVSVVVTGTDVDGQPISETLPAFTAGSGSAVTGSKAFKTITQVALPASGTAVTIAIGTGSKLGLTRRLSRNSVLAAFLNGVKESTAPTVAFDATNLCNNTITLNSSLNGNPVIVDFYEN